MSKTTKLVILAGSPRGGIKTWKSIYKNLVDENTDLAICTGDSLQNNFTLRKNISYWWIFKEYENWDKYYIENKNFFLIENFKLYAALIAIIVSIIWNNVLATISIGMASFLILSNI